MPQVHRMGDCNTGGGCVTSIPQSSVFVNNRLTVVDGSIGTGHGVPPHCGGCWITQQGGGVNGGPGSGGPVPNVFAEFIPVNDLGDVDSCGHPRAEGSPNVFTHGS
jgi:hypothetical protein